MITEQATHAEQPDRRRQAHLAQRIFAARQPHQGGHRAGHGEAHGQQLKGRHAAGHRRQQGQTGPHGDGADADQGGSTAPVHERVIRWDRPLGRSPRTGSYRQGHAPDSGPVSQWPRSWRRHDHLSGTTYLQNGLYRGFMSRGVFLTPSSIAYKRVAAPFIAEGRHRPVAGHETDIVAERPKLGLDRGHQGVEITAREIGPTDRALE